jgi:MFS family permease
MWICKFFNRSYRSEVRDDGLLRNLDLIVISAAIGTILFSNAGGPAFTGYASALGAGEFMFGLVSALPILGSLMQLYVSYLVEKTGKRKALFLAGGIIQRSIWLLTAAIPLILPDRLAALRIWALLGMITAAAISGSFVGITHTSMVAEIVPIDIRGRFLTTRQRLATIVSMISGFCSSIILDRFTGLSGYTVVFFAAGLAGLCDVLLYVRFKFPDAHRSAGGFSLVKGFKECFRAKKTRDYIIFFCAWSFAVNISAPFFNKYAIDILKLSFTQIIIFGQISANIMALLIVKRWGRFIDRYGCVPLMLVTGTITSTLTLVWLPATVGNFVPLLLFNMIGGFFWCANEACAVNMQLSHTPAIGRPLVLALYAVVTSLSAAAAFICGGAFLELTAPVMAAAKLTLFGTPFDHYKLLFVMATALRLTSVLAFLPRVWNEKELVTKEVYNEIYQRTIYKIKMLRIAIIVAKHRRRFIKEARNETGEGGNAV